jgi:hypothetical protein
MNTIQSQWEAYVHNVIPEAAGDVQILETRMAYYAGAMAVLAILAEIVCATDNDEAVAAVMIGLKEECQAFARAVLEREAPA